MIGAWGHEEMIQMEYQRDGSIERWSLKSANHLMGEGVRRWYLCKFSWTFLKKKSKKLQKYWRAPSLSLELADLGSYRGNPVACPPTTIKSKKERKKKAY